MALLRRSAFRCCRRLPDLRAMGYRLPCPRQGPDAGRQGAIALNELRPSGEVLPRLPGRRHRRSPSEGRSPGKRGSVRGYPRDLRKGRRASGRLPEVHGVTAHGKKGDREEEPVFAWKGNTGSSSLLASFQAKATRLRWNACAPKGREVVRSCCHGRSARPVLRVVGSREEEPVFAWRESTGSSSLFGGLPEDFDFKRRERDEEASCRGWTLKRCGR
jgi:hypothetical protein